MRRCFSEMLNLKKIALREIESGIARIENWWISKYKLPSNHKLFLSRSIASLHIEMIKDLLIKKEQLEKDLTKATGTEFNDLMNQLNSINNALDDTINEDFSGDPLIDKWEKELLEGITPNLNEGFKNAKRL
jgi:hypothetical protein